MSSVNLERELTHILEQIRQDRFGGRDAPHVVLDAGTGLTADGASLRGGFEIRIARRNGDTAVLFHQSLDGTDTVVKLKDAFSEALSQVLGDHSSWPR